MKKYLQKSITALAITVLIAGCGGNSEEEKQEDLKVVETIMVNYGLPNGLSVRKTGTLKPEVEVQIIAEGAGKVLEVFFEEGDYVERNQVLAKLGDAVSTAQADINQAQAASALQNASQTLNIARSTAEEAVRQADIALNNAKLAYDNAVATRQNTSTALEESEKLARIAVETVELTIDNIQESSSQSVNSIYENAINTVNSALTTADSTLKDLNTLLGVEDNPRGSNLAYRDALRAADPSAFDSASANNLYAFEHKPAKLSEDAGRATIGSKLPEVESHLSRILLTLDYIDQALKTAPAGSGLTQSEIDNWRSTFNIHSSTINNSLLAVKQIGQSINSTGISNDTSISNATQSLESARRQLSATLANNQVQKQGLDHAIDLAWANKSSAESGLRVAQENARANVISAGNAVNAAGQQFSLAKLTQDSALVKAPISGRITSRLGDPGMLITAGAAIGKVGVLQELEMNIDYNYTESRYLATSGSVRIFVDGDKDNPITGQIQKISPTADPVTRQIAVEISILNLDESLKPNLIAEAEIPLAPEFFADKILVPMKAVRVGQEQKSVLVIKDGQVAEISVEIGQAYDSYIEVKGLTENQTIIKDAADLRIGEPVTDRPAVKYREPANMATGAIAMD